MQKQRDISTDQCHRYYLILPMYVLYPKFQVSSYLLWLYSLLWVGLFWTCASWLSCPKLKILMNNLLVGVICFISTFYINWRVNMVIVSRSFGNCITVRRHGYLQCMKGVFQIFRDQNIFEHVLWHAFYPNAFSCDILAFYKQDLNCLPLEYRSDCDLVTFHIVDFRCVVRFCDFWFYSDAFKGTPITKALTCMKIYLYKQKWKFCQGDVYFWLFCCLSNFCISHRLIYIQTYSFWVRSSFLISHFLFTSWFDSICVTVACWVNFKEKHLHKHELQFSDYNVWEYFRPNIHLSCRKIFFAILA